MQVVKNSLLSGHHPILRRIIPLKKKKGKPFQSDNIWKKKARQGKAQQHPLTPQQEWQKQVNSSSLWLGGGVVLLALYLAAVRAGTVALDASAVVLIVVVGCFCVYTAASLGRLMKNKPEEKAAKKKKKAKKE